MNRVRHIAWLEGQRAIMSDNIRLLASPAVKDAFEDNDFCRPVSARDPVKFDPRHKS